jgi:hypothetical protein
MAINDLFVASDTTCGTSRPCSESVCKSVSKLELAPAVEIPGNSPYSRVANEFVRYIRRG